MNGLEDLNNIWCVWCDSDRFGVFSRFVPVGLSHVCRSAWVWLSWVSHVDRFEGLEGISLCTLVPCRHSVWTDIVEGSCGRYFVVFRTSIPQTSNGILLISVASSANGITLDNKVTGSSASAKMDCLDLCTHSNHGMQEFGQFQK